MRAQIISASKVRKSKNSSSRRPPQRNSASKWTLFFTLILAATFISLAEVLPVGEQQQLHPLPKNRDLQPLESSSSSKDDRRVVHWNSLQTPHQLSRLFFYRGKGEARVVFYQPLPQERWSSARTTYQFLYEAGAAHSSRGGPAGDFEQCDNVGGSSSNKTAHNTSGLPRAQPSTYSCAAETDLLLLNRSTSLGALVQDRRKEQKESSSQGGAGDDKDYGGKNGGDGEAAGSGN